MKFHVATRLITRDLVLVISHFLFLEPEYFREKPYKAFLEMYLQNVLSLALLARYAYAAAVLRFGCSQVVVERIDP